MHVFHVNYFILNRVGLGYLPCVYMGKLECLGGKTNGSCLSVLEASEMMDCDVIHHLKSQSLFYS